MLSVVDARRAAIALLGRCGEVAIAAAVLRAQEAESRGRYEEMASWRSIAEAALEYTEHNERGERPNVWGIDDLPRNEGRNESH